MNACLVNLEHAGKIASVFPARRKAHRNHDKPRHRERNRSPFVRQPSPAIGDAGLIRNTREAPLGFLDPRQTTTTTTMDVQMDTVEINGRSDFALWAIQRAQEIVMAEGAALALAARDMDEAALKENGTALGKAIADAMLEVFDGLMTE
jgi:hypothetical protein